MIYRSIFMLSFLAVGSAFQFSSVRPSYRTSTKSLSMKAGDTIVKKKIVVTGASGISSVGMGDAMFENLNKGVSGIERLPSWADGFTCKVGSLVDDEKVGFNPSDWMDGRSAQRNGRYTHFAMASSKLALQDAKLDVETLERERFGVLIGSGIGGVEFFEENCKKFEEAGRGAQGMRRVSPFLIPALIANTASGIVAIELGAEGANFGVVSACASGTHAIGTALDFMQRGEMDVCIAGGSEAAMTPLCFAGFNVMRAMCTTFNDDPKRASRPYDKNRAGFVMGEGCGVIVLETEEHALARGAEIYCELAGYGATCDAHHITAPHPEGKGLARALEMSLRTGGIEAEEVDYINAHGTSTPYNDKFETMAIKKVLGDHAYKVKVSSIKSMIGHTLGAAGGIEAAVTAKAFKSKIIPPTLNIEDPDPECDLDYCSGTEGVKVDRIRAAISDNLGFGGHNAAISFKEYVKK